MDFGIRLASTVGVVLLVVSCVPGRPDRLLEADVIGLVASTSRPGGSVISIELEGGEVVEIPESATAANIQGITAEQLILIGEDYGRTWYATLRLRENSPIDGCYGISGVAYDEPDAVIIVSGEWRGVGLRLPKRDDFQVPANVMDSQGVYRMGDEYPNGSFCVDANGSVFAVS